MGARVCAVMSGDGTAWEIRLGHRWAALRVELDPDEWEAGQYAGDFPFASRLANGGGWHCYLAAGPTRFRLCTGPSPTSRQHPSRSTSQGLCGTPSSHSRA